MCELWSLQLDGQSGIESIEVTKWRVASEYPRREGSMIGYDSCDGSAARRAGIYVELDRVPAILMNDEGAINGGEELIKPGQVLSKLRGEGEGSFFSALPEGVQHSVEEFCWGVDRLKRHTAIFPGGVSRSLRVAVGLRDHVYNHELDL